MVIDKVITSIQSNNALQYFVIIIYVCPLFYLRDFRLKSQALVGIHMQITSVKNNNFATSFQQVLAAEPLITIRNISSKARSR
jgi:hypothetical protein